MEVCCRSYGQNWFLDPIAAHFLNLETSATGLARALLVLHEMGITIFKNRNIYMASFQYVSNC